MRCNRLTVALPAIAALLAVGCWYQRPDLEKMYAKTVVGMSKDEVVKVLGQPTHIVGNEMFYLYDDPDEPVRFLFVLNDKGFVVEKYYQTKKDLFKKAEETKGEVPPVVLMPGEEKRTYPGAALPRFEKKPVGGY